MMMMALRGCVTPCKSGINDVSFQNTFTVSQPVVNQTYLFYAMFETMAAPLHTMTVFLSCGMAGLAAAQAWKVAVCQCWGSVRDSHTVSMRPKTLWE